MRAAAKRSFWHLRLWEVLFLLIVGTLLFRQAIMAGRDDAPDDLMALMVSNLVISIKSDGVQVPPAERAYPSEMRWPCVGGFASGAVFFWQIGIRMGIDTRIVAAFVGLAGAGMLACLEMRSWHWAHAARPNEV